MSVPPFHRLLSFYSNRSNEPDTQTIRLQDSLTGNLALGLDFPVALGLAVARHIYLRNTSLFSLNIHVPTVATRHTWLEDLHLDTTAAPGPYTCGELVSAARPLGVAATIDAVGLWALAADVHTGRISADDVDKFRRGTLFESIERRRRTREQVLPLWRGGPISVAGHSYVVEKMFGVRVYQDIVTNNTAKSAGEFSIEAMDPRIGPTSWK